MVNSPLLGSLFRVSICLSVTRFNCAQTTLYRLKINMHHLCGAMQYRQILASLLSDFDEILCT